MADDLDEWRSVKFSSVARKFEVVYSRDSPVERYHSERNERWFVRFDGTSEDRVLGRLVRARTEGIPQVELDTELTPLKIAEYEAIGETNHFGVYDDSVLVFEQNRSALKPASLAYYLGRMMKRKGADIRLKFTPLVFERFSKVLPHIDALTLLEMKPQRYARRKLAKSSGLPIFELLDIAAENAENAAIRLSAGVSPSIKDSFGHKLAAFFKNHLVKEDNIDDFDYLRMTALLDTGAVTKLDLSDKHVVFKQVRIPLSKDRSIDRRKAYKVISGAYRGMQRRLRSESVYRLEPKYEQVTL